MNDLVVVATELGTTALPFLADIAGVLASNIDVVIAAFTAWIVITKALPALLNLIRTAMFNVATGTGALAKGAASASIAIRGLTTVMASLSAVLTVGLTAALLVVPALIDNFSISLKKLAQDTGLTVGFLEDLDTQLSLTGRFGKNPFTFLDLSLSGLISVLDGTRDQVVAVAEALNPLYQNLQTMGLSAFQAETFLRGFTSTMTEATDAAIADMAAAIQEDITLITALQQSLGRGAIDLGIFKDRMVGLGFSTTEALALADAGLDQFGKSVDKNGKIVKNWASLSDEEFEKFKEDVVESLQVAVGEFESFNDAFSTTPEELQRQLSLAVRIARQRNRDIREILAADLTPDVEHALLGLEPALRNAWARGGQVQKRQIEKDAVELERVTGQGAQRAVDAIGKAVPKAPKPIKITADAQSTYRTIGVVKNELAAIPDEEVIIHAKTTGGSTAFDLINHLTAELKKLTTAEWDVDIHATGTARFETALKAAAKAVAAVIKEIEKSVESVSSMLDKIKAKASEFAGTISGAIGGFADIGGAFGEGETPLSAVLEVQVSGAQQLADVLEALKRQGASKALLSEVAETGAGFGQALLQGGPAQIKEANAALQTIADLAKQTGKGLSEAFFGQKIDKLEHKLDLIRDDLRRERQAEKIIVNIQGWVGNDQDLAKKLRDELIKLKNRNVTSGI